MLVLVSVRTQAQTYINILDNTYINATGGVTIYLESQTANSITKAGNMGGLYMDSESDQLRWNIKNGTGEFYVPFCSSVGNTIPFIYDIGTAGSSDGFIDFNTYETTDDNLPLPTTVTGINSSLGINNSTHVIDRFWVIDTDGYATKPMGDYTFTYDDNDLVGNLIDESLLASQRWNNDDNKWGDWLYSPTANVTSNTVDIIIANVEDQYNVWTLVDQGDPLAITIVAFFGTCNEELRVVYWETWGESLSDTFNLERSYDGITFNPFHTFGANGSPSRYTIFDTDAYEGAVYYKLNGIVVALTCDGGDDLVIRPNPNNGRFIVDHNGIHTFIVYDGIGRVVYNETTEHKVFNLSHLSSGEYFMRVINHTGNEVFRLIIAK